MEKVKIVLDADVLIHFCEAGRLSMLPEILPEKDECKKFIDDVLTNGSKLPKTDITKYIPETFI